MLNDPNMLSYFIELIGRSEHKPFECVGSIDEVKLAVSLAIRKIEEKAEELPLLFKEFKSLGMYSADDLDIRNSVCCGSWNDENLLPQEFCTILKKEMERLL